MESKKYRKRIEKSYFDQDKDIINIRDLVRLISELHDISELRFLEIENVLKKEYPIFEKSNERKVIVNIKNIDNNLIDRYKPDKAFSLQYCFNESNDSIDITPQTDYFCKLSNRNKISYTGSWWHLNLSIQFPNLDIKIINNGNKPFFITRYELDINSSNPIEKPLIFLSRTNCGSNGHSGESCHLFRMKVATL